KRLTENGSDRLERSLPPSRSQNLSSEPVRKTSGPGGLPRSSRRGGRRSISRRTDEVTTVLLSAENNTSETSQFIFSLKLCSSFPLAASQTRSSKGGRPDIGATGWAAAISAPLGDTTTARSCFGFGSGERSIFRDASRSAPRASMMGNKTAAAPRIARWPVMNLLPSLLSSLSARDKKYQI